MRYINLNTGTVWNASVGARGEAVLQGLGFMSEMRAEGEAKRRERAERFGRWREANLCSTCHRTKQRCVCA